MLRKFLILLASPEAAESKWVHDELDHWCRTPGRSQNLIVVFLKGQIVINLETKRIDWGKTDSLPPVLREHLQHVPLYVDLRHIAQSGDLTLENADFGSSFK